ncbi:MAG: ATP-binding protein [Thermomicrobiales bacterium]
MVDSSSRYRQSHLFVENRDLIATKKEDHWFDRKSFKTRAEALANALIGFANSDGGTMLIGVSDSGEIEGVDGDTDHLNSLRQAAIDFTIPRFPTPQI